MAAPRSTTLDRQREVEAIAAAAREQANQETLRGGDVSLVGNRTPRSIIKSRRAVEAEFSSPSSLQRHSLSHSHSQLDQSKAQRPPLSVDSLSSIGDASELGTPPREDLDSAVSVSSLGTPPRNEEENELQVAQSAAGAAQPAEASEEQEAAPVSTSRPRGRPRKSQPASEPQGQGMSNNTLQSISNKKDEVQIVDPPVRRKPGRPRKHPLPDASLAPSVPVPASAPAPAPEPREPEAPVRRKPGRPRKQPLPEPVPVQVEESAEEEEMEDDDDDDDVKVPAPLRAHNLGAYWDLPVATTLPGSGPRKSARAVRRVESDSELSSAEDSDEVAAQLAQLKPKKTRRATEPAKGASASQTASGSAAAGPSGTLATPVKRGPGRPRKNVPEVIIGAVDTSSAEAAPDTPSAANKAAAKPAWQRKVFLAAGLYSSTFKADKPGVRRSRASMPTKLNGTMTLPARKASAAALLQGTARQRNRLGQTIFPPPVHFGETLLVQQRDFRLPFPLLEQESGIRDKMNSRRKPPPYGQISTNRFVSRKKIKAEEPICQCDPSSDCGEDCMNRILQYVCDPKSCPCGERCTNGTLGKRKGHKTDVSFYGERGFGLRAVEAIPKNAFIDEYRGEVINMAECARRVTSHYMAWGNYYFLDYDTVAGEVLDAGLRGNALRFANHSCNPNCYIEKWLISGSDENRDAEFQIGLFALRDVEAGEELTYDYGWSSFARKAVAGGIAASGMTGGLSGGLASGMLGGGLTGPRLSQSSAGPPPSTDITMSERCLCGAANCAGILGGKKAPAGAAGKQLIAAATAAAAGALSAKSKGKRRQTDTPLSSPRKGVASASVNVADSPTGARKSKLGVPRVPRPPSDQQSHDPEAERAARLAREARQEEAAARAAAARANRLAERRARTGQELSSEEEDDDDEQQAIELERYEGQTQDEEEADEALQVQLRANVEHVLANDINDMSDGNSSATQSRSRAVVSRSSEPSGSRPMGRPAPRASALASRARMLSPSPDLSPSPSPAPEPRPRKFERRRTEHEMLQDLADEAARKAAERAVSEESAGNKQTTRSGRAIAPPTRWEPTGKKRIRTPTPEPAPRRKEKTLRGTRPTPWIYRPVEPKRKPKDTDAVSSTVLGKRKAGEQGAPGNDSLDANTSRDADNQPPPKRGPGRPRKHPLPAAPAAPAAPALPAAPAERNVAAPSGSVSAGTNGQAEAGPSSAVNETPIKKKRAPRKRKKRGPGRPRIHPLPFFDFSKYPPGTEFVTGDGQPWDLQSKPPATGRRPKIYTKEQYKKKLQLRRERNAYLARIRRVTQKSDAAAKAGSEQRDDGESSDEDRSGASSESGNSSSDDEEGNRAARTRTRSCSTSTRAATTSPNKSTRKRKERFVTPGEGGEGDEEADAQAQNLPGTLASVPPGEVMFLSIVPALLHENGMSLDEIRRARNAFGSRVRRLTERGYDRTSALKLASKLSPTDNPELALTRAQQILQRLRDADKKLRGRELARLRRERARKEKDKEKAKTGKAGGTPAAAPSASDSRSVFPGLSTNASTTNGGAPGPSDFPGALANGGAPSASPPSMTTFLPSHLPPGSSVAYSIHERALSAGLSPGVSANQFARISPVVNAIAGPSSRPDNSRDSVPFELDREDDDVEMDLEEPAGPTVPAAAAAVAAPDPVTSPIIATASRPGAPVPLPWEGTEWNASLPPRTLASASPLFPLGPSNTSRLSFSSPYSPRDTSSDRAPSPGPRVNRISGRLQPAARSSTRQLGLDSPQAPAQPTAETAGSSGNAGSTFN